MEKALGRIWGRIFPIILIAALLLTGIVSTEAIKNLRGNARVINYTGFVRGAVQRLVKKELNHEPDEELMNRLDRILKGLSEGSREFNLIKLNSPGYHVLLKEMNEKWADMKVEIENFRSGGQGDKLFSLSEEYFVLADRTAVAAEVYTEKNVQTARNIIFYMNLAFILLGCFSVLSSAYQEKKRKKLEKIEEENKKKSEELSKRLQEVLVPMNEVSELMYISDIETYELLFANHAGRETFHLDEKKGMKCYEALQGFDAPCPFCTAPFSKKDKNYTWEYTNPLTKRHYLLKDRLVEWEGRPARLEIAFDITETANEKLELERRLESDNVLVECIKELYCNHDLHQATVCVLEQVGRLFLAERSYVFALHGEYLSNMEEWCMEGIEPQISRLQNLNQSEFSIWINMFYNMENIIIEDVEKLKEKQKKEYELLTSQGIKRAILVPLEQDGKLNGLIGLDNPALDLLKHAEAFFETLRYFLMLAIRRSEDEETLRRLSYHDTLTSFYNRNRYIKDIEALEGKTHSLGVVFLDVNGLKEINDHLGHDAGDQLLKRCAQTIRSVFPSGSFYRIGGDEFVILCTNIREERFLKIIEELKNGFDYRKCQVAIGSRWVEKCEDVQSVISAADELMYENKRAFYQKHQPSGRYRHTGDR